MELKIDSENVLKLAKKYPGWEYGLKELFPGLFNDELYFSKWSIIECDAHFGSVIVQYDGKNILYIDRRGLQRYHPCPDIFETENVCDGIRIKLRL